MIFVCDTSNKQWSAYFEATSISKELNSGRQSCLMYSNPSVKRSIFYNIYSWLYTDIYTWQSRSRNRILFQNMYLILVPLLSLKYFLCTVARLAPGKLSPMDWKSLVMLPFSLAVLGMIIYKRERIYLEMGHHRTPKAIGRGISSLPLLDLISVFWSAPVHKSGYLRTIGKEIILVTKWCKT